MIAERHDDAVESRADPIGSVIDSVDAMREITFSSWDTWKIRSDG